MKTIDQVELKVKPYSDVFERAVDEMLKVYSYATSGVEFVNDAKYIDDKGEILLKQAAILEPGQSTEVRELQSKTMDLAKSMSRYALNDYIAETTGAKFIIATGDKVQIDFKAQAHRRTDGCTIHTTFDAKYGGSERLVSGETIATMSREEDLWDLTYYFVSKPFDEILSSIGLSDTEGHEIEFVKAIRDNDLIPGINLNGLSDDDIADIGEMMRNSKNDYSDFVRFLMKYTGLSRPDVLEKIVRISEPTARVDLGQFSFHFEYDIEIDEETFRSYFMIEGDGEYEAKAAEQARLDQIKANVSVVKPKVLKKLQELDYDIDRYDLEDLAEQIAEVQDRVEVFDEIEDGDEHDEMFFSMVDDFAKSSEYVVHFSDDGSCNYSLTGDRKDGHVYSFETGMYLYTGGYGETFIYIDGVLYDLSGSFPHFADEFTIEEAFDYLSDQTNCSVLDLPKQLVSQGYTDFNDETLLSATEDSEVYAWLEDNVSVYDIMDILEEEKLIESVVGEYNKTFETFEVDFSGCFED